MIRWWIRSLDLPRRQHDAMLRQTAKKTTAITGAGWLGHLDKPHAPKAKHKISITQEGNNGSEWGFCTTRFCRVVFPASRPSCFCNVVFRTSTPCRLDCLSVTFPRKRLLRLRSDYNDQSGYRHAQKQMGCGRTRGALSDLPRESFGTTSHLDRRILQVACLGDLFESEPTANVRPSRFTQCANHIPFNSWHCRLCGTICRFQV
jgi:hypothetical protein